jgi:hypothetical protein
MDGLFILQNTQERSLDATFGVRLSPPQWRWTQGKPLCAGDADRFGCHSRAGERSAALLPALFFRNQNYKPPDEATCLVPSPLIYGPGSGILDQVAASAESGQPSCPDGERSP